MGGRPLGAQRRHGPGFGGPRCDGSSFRPDARARRGGETVHLDPGGVVGSGPRGDGRHRPGGPRGRIVESRGHEEGIRSQGRRNVACRPGASPDPGGAAATRRVFGEPRRHFLSGIASQGLYRGGAGRGNGGTGAGGVGAEGGCAGTSTPTAAERPALPPLLAGAAVHAR